MRGKYADDGQSLAAKVIILVTSFIALPFIIAATSYQRWFYSDGYGGIADGMSLIPVSTTAHDPAYEVQSSLRY